MLCHSDRKEILHWQNLRRQYTVCVNFEARYSQRQRPHLPPGTEIVLTFDSDDGEAYVNEVSRKDECLCQ